MTPAAIECANIAKTAHSQQSDTFGTPYPVSVVDPHAHCNRIALAESRNRLGNGSNRKNGSECKNSPDRMQLHVPSKVTKNHNSQAEPVRRFHDWRQA